MASDVIRVRYKRGNFGPDMAQPWVISINEPSCRDCQQGFICTLAMGHMGTHKAGTDMNTGTWVAEWDYLPEELAYPDGI